LLAALLAWAVASIFKNSIIMQRRKIPAPTTYPLESIPSCSVLYNVVVSSHSFQNPLSRTFFYWSRKTTARIALSRKNRFRGYAYNKLDFFQLIIEIMREIGAFEARNKLGTLLDWVAAGEEVLITRHGKAVARLVPAEPGFNRARARQAARGLLETSQGVTLGGLGIKDLVNEGRP
jgi:prevent-host-death family protein